MSTVAPVTAAVLCVSSCGFMASVDELSSSAFEGFSATTVGGLVDCSESDLALVEG